MSFRGAQVVIPKASMPARPYAAGPNSVCDRRLVEQPTLTELTETSTENKKYLPLFSTSEGMRLLAGLLLAVSTLLLYNPVSRFQFINYDDDAYVTSNFHVRGGITLKSVKWAFTTFDAANWHPLTWLSHMLDCELFGLDAAGHHATSVALHGGAALLLFAALRRMTGAPWRSGAVAALFALHPLRVESVVWIS